MKFSGGTNVFQKYNLDTDIVPEKWIHQKWIQKKT